MWPEFKQLGQLSDIKKFTSRNINLRVITIACVNVTTTAYIQLIKNQQCNNNENS